MQATIEKSPMPMNHDDSIDSLNHEEPGQSQRRSRPDTEQQPLVPISRPSAVIQAEQRSNGSAGQQMQAAPVSERQLEMERR